MPHPLIMLIYIIEIDWDRKRKSPERWFYNRKDCAKYLHFVANKFIKHHELLKESIGTIQDITHKKTLDNNTVNVLYKDWTNKRIDLYIKSIRLLAEQTTS